MHLHSTFGVKWTSESLCSCPSPRLQTTSTQCVRTHLLERRQTLIHDSTSIPNMSLTVAPQPIMWKSASSKGAAVATTLPISFDRDLEKNVYGHVAHHSISSSNSSEDSFDKESQIPPLPTKKYARIFRHFRCTFFNVYRRLFSIVFVLNLIGVAILFGRYKGARPPAFLADLANAASANIMVAIAMRQDYIINICYRLVYLPSLRNISPSPSHNA